MVCLLHGFPARARVDFLHHLKNTEQTGALLPSLIVGNVFVVFLFIDCLELVNGLLGQLHGLSTIPRSGMRTTGEVLFWGT